MFNIPIAAIVRIFRDTFFDKKDTLDPRDRRFNARKFILMFISASFFIMGIMTIERAITLTNENIQLRKMCKKHDADSSDSAKSEKGKS